jgi:hypothetical protein
MSSMLIPFRMELISLMFNVQSCKLVEIVAPKFVMSSILFLFRMELI